MEIFLPCWGKILLPILGMRNLNQSPFSNFDDQQGGPQIELWHKNWGGWMGPIITIHVENNHQKRFKTFCGKISNYHKVELESAGCYSNSTYTFSIAKSKARTSISHTNLQSIDRRETSTNFLHFSKCPCNDVWKM